MEFVLEYVTLPDLAKICQLSTTLKSYTIKHLQNHAGAQLNHRTFITSIKEYVALLSQELDNFVYYGSENYIPLDEAIFRAVTNDNKELISYFISRSLDRYKHVKLILLSATLTAHVEIGQWTLQNFERQYSELKLTMFSAPIEWEVISEYNSISLFKHIESNQTLPYIGQVLSSYVECGSSDVVKYIIKKNADLNPSSYLDIAASKNNLDIVKFIVEQYPERLMRLNLSLALNAANRRGHTNVITYIRNKLQETEKPWYRLLLRLVYFLLDIAMGRS